MRAPTPTTIRPQHHRTLPHLVAPPHRQHNHLGRELHPTRTQPEVEDRLTPERPQPTIHIPHRPAEQPPRQRRQHRVAHVPVQQRHRPRLDPPGEPVPHHQISAPTQILQKRAQCTQVVGAIAITDHDERRRRSTNTGHHRMAIATLISDHHARARLHCQSSTPISAPVVDHHHHTDNLSTVEEINRLPHTR